MVLHNCGRVCRRLLFENLYHLFDRGFLFYKVLEKINSIIY
jgi:hypothetical protein